MQGTSGDSTTTFLRSTLTKEQIGTITFTNDNIVPEGMTSVDVSKDSDGTILLWYGEANSDTGLYDIYIGSDNGITSFYSGWFLFARLNNVTSIDLKYIDTSKVTSMYCMFYYCKSLVELNLNTFDTSKVTSMRQMFQECSKLISLDLSSFDTSNVTDMRNMFYSCGTLVKLNVDSFDTSRVTDMSGMFGTLWSLKYLDLSSFNIGNVTNTSYMFYYDSLTTLDLRNADFSSVTNYTDMFQNASTNITIYLKDSQVAWFATNFAAWSNNIIPVAG